MQEKNDYRKPIRTEKTLLGQIFFMQPRQHSKKLGRSLHVAFTHELPLLQGFTPRYIYWVHFRKDEEKAGNHFHHKKAELFYPIIGDFSVYLEDPKTRRRETILLHEKENPVLFIPTKIAHAVIAHKKNAVLLVLASAGGGEGDIFPYEVT